MNNALIIANVGGRGSVFNFVQMSMFLGQQATLGGTRIKRGYASGRVLPHLKARSVDPVDHGFIEASFRTGLSPVDMYMHAIGSRISESYKSLLTARSGYLQRRLINALQDYYVYDDDSVRDVHGNMIETIYGGDAIDPIKVKLAKAKE
jgi:DNA-directed RNA polymerase subunit A'